MCENLGYDGRTIRKKPNGKALKQFSASTLKALQPNMRIQVGALCYRATKGKPEILLITSRGTGRWIVPKGWPIGGLSPAASAEQEAWEEAGAVGRLKDVCLGVFSYTKCIKDGSDFPCQVALFPLRVKSLARSYPESSERRRRWFSPKKAAARVSEADLSQLLRRFDPSALS